MFVFIGRSPGRTGCGDLVERDDAGFILTGAALRPGGHPTKGWKPLREPYPARDECARDLLAGDVRSSARSNESRPRSARVRWRSSSSTSTSPTCDGRIPEWTGRSRRSRAASRVPLFAAFSDEDLAIADGTEAMDVEPGEVLMAARASRAMRSSPSYRGEFEVSKASGTTRSRSGPGTRRRSSVRWRIFEALPRMASVRAMLPDASPPHRA